MTYIATHRNSKILESGIHQGAHAGDQMQMTMITDSGSL